MNASEVWHEMERLRTQFDHDMKIVRDKCIHTYSNGRSAITPGPGGHWYKCDVCWKEMESN